MLEEPVDLQPELAIWTHLSPPATEPNQGSTADAVDLAARLVGARRSSLLMPSPESGVLHIAASTGIEDVMAGHIRVRLGDPIAGVVAATGEPVLVNDQTVKPDARLRGYQTGSYISLPVPIDGQTCGVLNVADPHNPNGFQPDDLRALQGLVRQVSSGISLQQVNRRAKALERTVKQLRRKVVQVLEAERQRIARDLHDEAGHALTAAILRIDVEMAQRAGDHAAISTLGTAREELVSCAKSLHEIAFNLRPRILEDFGLHAAIRSLGRYTMGIAQLEVEVEISGDEWALDELEELAILRVVQEALTNARKYSGAGRITVSLHYEPEFVTLHVEDDGIGIGTRRETPPSENARVSMGIKGMRERIELLGGKFWIGRGPAGGTLVSALLPH